jgi:hypothetical protein
MVSPSFIQIYGSRRDHTPPDIPVLITSPERKVCTVDIYSINFFNFVIHHINTCMLNHGTSI